MAASPVSIPSPNLTVRRRRLVLTQRRLEANRRNAARSTGPRTAAGKARVARNPIKHGFFVARERWTPTQHREFEKLREGFRDEFSPVGAAEEGCITTLAAAYVQMAAMLRYENVAALKYHQQCENEMNQRISTADAADAALLEAQRDRLRRAGLWRPNLPGPREAMAIIRYSGSLDRTIRGALAELEAVKKMRLGGASPGSGLKKQTHFTPSPRSGPEAAEGPRMPLLGDTEVQKQTHFEATPSKHENAKANPLSSMFMGNRHQRRRAKALAARRR